MGSNHFAREDATLRFKHLPQLFAAVCFAVATATPALAQSGDLQPGHAISDLHAARDILSHGSRGVSPADQQSIKLIDTIISSTVRIARFESERHQVQSGVDATASSQRRHENARVLLSAALRDLNGRERNPQARPYLQQARYQLGELVQNITTQAAQHNR
jgi:hypothetical protein